MELTTPNKLDKIWRNADGTFKKGHPQSSDGRPKGKTLKEYARDYLMLLPDEEKTEYLATLPPEIVWKMAEGNPHQSGDTKIEFNPKPLLDAISDNQSNKENPQAQ